MCFASELLAGREWDSIRHHPLQSQEVIGGGAIRLRLPFANAALDSRPALRKLAERASPGERDEIAEPDGLFGFLRRAAFPYGNSA